MDENIIAQQQTETGSQTQEPNTQPENVAPTNDERSTNENQEQPQAPKIKTPDDAFTKAMQSDIQKHQERFKKDVSDTQSNTEGEASSDNQDRVEEPKDNQVATDYGQHNDSSERNNNDGENTEVFSRQALRAETEQISNYIREVSVQEARDSLSGFGQFINNEGKSKLSVYDLQTTDNEGNTIFVNPFNQNEPYATMEEARKGLHDFNELLELKFERAREASEKNWVERYKPNIRMKAFTHRFTKMSKLAQEMFMEQATAKNALVFNKKGKFVGFKNNFDLETEATIIENTIKRIQESMTGKEVATNNEQENSEPVANIPTSTQSLKSESNQQSKPKNVNDAFTQAILNDIKKKKGGK